MNQRPRMVNTLVCLVVSMTGVAGLLGYLDPSVSPSPDSLPFDTIESVAWEVVSDADNLDPQRWQAVTVASYLEGDGRETLLAARSNQESSHFFVHTDGHISSGPLWRDQRELAALPGTIVVEVAQERLGEVMSDAQWVGVRSLVQSLNETLAPAGVELPITADTSWQAAYQSVEQVTDIATSS